MSQTLCPLPWIHQYINTKGDIYTCIHTKASKKGGLKKNGSVYNAGQDSLEESRNSETLKAIRLKMLRGEFPYECIRCQTDEKSHILSRRKWELSYWKDVFSYEKAREITSTDGSISVVKTPVFFLDIRFGNQCNLKCRMCGPSDSSYWYSDYVKVHQTNKYADGNVSFELIKDTDGFYHTKNNIYDWFNRPQFWNEIKKMIPFIKYMTIEGGEPLLIKKHYELLSYIIKKGKPEEITLDYSTNLTILPQKVLDMWKRFKLIRVHASLDAYGKLNDYIRHPSRFVLIDQNLKRLSDSLDNTELSVQATISVYNIFHFPDLIHWFIKRQKFLKTKNYLRSHLVRNPSFLNVKILPIKYKNKIKDKFLNFLYGLKDFLRRQKTYSEEQVIEAYNYYESELMGYLDFIFSEDCSHLLPKFLKYSSQLDKIRGEGLEELLPELYSACKENIKVCKNRSFQPRF